MPDEELAGQQPEEEAPAEGQPTPPAPPAVTSADIEAVRKEMDERIKGFQRLVAQKEQEAEAARKERDELRMAGMTQDEKDALEWQKVQEENAALKDRVALLSLAQEYPNEVPILNQISEAADYKAQLELIRSLAAQREAAANVAQQPQAPADAGVPPVDPNNPATNLPVGTGPTFGGMPMTEELADQILKSVDRMR